VIADESPLWRVGYHAAPLEFTPRELYGYSHRFDDIAHRFRTLYLSELDLTCLREVLADFRPNLEAHQRHIQRYGPEAADDFVTEPVTEKWRRENVLLPQSLTSGTWLWRLRPQRARHPHPLVQGDRIAARLTSPTLHLEQCM
jgi:hypothetical protein